MNKFLRTLINSGVRDTDSLERRRQVSLLNVSVLLCVCTSGTFIVFNIIERKWVLLWANIVLLTLTACLLFLKRLKNFDAGVVVMATLFSGYFFTCTLLFRNGLHFAIIIMMAIVALLINHKLARRCMLAFQVLLFCAYLYFKQSPAIIPALPDYRIYIIVILLLVILAVVLEYFKSRQMQYIRDLNKANEDLRESNRVKERMLSILSHDFNAPVAGLATTLDLFDSEVLTEAEFRQVSTKLKAQLQVLTISLADVLHWSKMQISGDTGQPGNINIAALLQEVLPLFAPVMAEKNIRQNIDIGDGINAFANRDHIKLIFRNLMSNAIKYSNPGGTVYINATQNQAWVTVCIRDEGAGMPPAILQALQNEQLKFTSSPGTAKEKGTGLGLVLVQEFIRKNNGRLDILSSIGAGSSFTVTLPAA